MNAYQISSLILSGVSTLACMGMFFILSDLQGRIMRLEAMNMQAAATAAAAAAAAANPSIKHAKH